MDNIITLLNLQKRILSYLLQLYRAPISETKFIDKHLKNMFYKYYYNIKLITHFAIMKMYS